MEKSSQVIRRPSSARPSQALAPANGGRLPPIPGHLLPRAFFEAPPQQVAPLLLGKLLVHRAGRHLLAGRIVEVEAYLGPHNAPPDPAAHSHRGPTPRNQVLFGPGGHAYVYSIYGRYFCMNVTCEVAGKAGCVLLRALDPFIDAQQMAVNRGLPPGEPYSGKRAARLTSGPSRLCQALAITRSEHNGLDLLDPRSSLQVRDDGFSAAECLVTPRIGIRHAAERPLRFALIGNACVSGPKSLPGKRLSLR